MRREGARCRGGGRSQSLALYSLSVPWPSCPYCGSPALSRRPSSVSHMVNSAPHATRVHFSTSARTGSRNSSACEGSQTLWPVPHCGRACGARTEGRLRSAQTAKQARRGSLAGGYANNCPHVPAPSFFGVLFTLPVPHWPCSPARGVRAVSVERIRSQNRGPGARAGCCQTCTSDRRQHTRPCGSCRLILCQAQHAVSTAAYLSAQADKDSRQRT